MTEKILFVDDDQALLDGIRRGLGRRFAIDTTVSPEQGLAMLSSEGPYAVIVADMNMPVMNGVKFLVAAKQRSPQSIRMMLTGDASLDTALKAVNDGNVFRFMTKPCPSADLQVFLEAGLRQHELEAAEKRAAILEEANRAKDNLLTTVSHELRTPLTILRLTTEILVRYSNDEGRVEAEPLAAIVAQTRRLSEIIDQVLDMVQLDAGLVILDSVPLDLSKLLRDVVETNQQDPCTLELEIERSEEPAICRGDPLRLRQVFAELLANAQKFSPPGAKIGIRLLWLANGYEVTVRDSGPGVPAHMVAQVFEPFVQREEVLVDKPPGLGLGLAIVRKVLDLHDASIAYRDDPDGGAVYSVFIPASVDRIPLTPSTR